jgi:hypothetical protein
MPVREQSPDTTVVSHQTRAQQLIVSAAPLHRKLASTSEIFYPTNLGIYGGCTTEEFPDIQIIEFSPS